jgi:hypothetical protein
VSFATNDERTAKRVSDALGTATEMRAMKNYAGHRLSPWLGPSDGVALGDRAAAADARRDHAAEDDADDAARQAQVRRTMQAGIARQVSLDPGDDMNL